jgi:hypothetical protein
VTQLGQQELMEAGPRRRIIVPEGHGAWWGVDPSTRRLAVAGVSRAANGELDRWVNEIPFAGYEGSRRLSHIYDETRAMVGSIPSWRGRPGVVLVEQPGGQHRNYELFYAVGVIVAAIDSALGGVHTELVVPSWWKKRACGRGDIYKPKRGDPEPYGVLTWARENGYPGSSWDSADAWGIAEAARREVELVQR